MIRRMSTQIAGPVSRSITDKLSSLKPIYLDVANESYKHNVAEGSESHFKVYIVAAQFDGMKPIQKHKMVNSILKEEFDAGLHALSITAKSPTQWEADGSLGAESHQTPNCLGGSKK